MTFVRTHVAASPCTACGVNRRDFLSAATLAALAIAFEGCSSSTAPANPSGGPLNVQLANFPALGSVGGVARVDGGSGSPTALVRTTASSFTALSMICPHQGTTVGITGAGFTCPNHNAQFTKTGSWTGGEPTGGLQAFGTAFDATANSVVIARPA